MAGEMLLNQNAMVTALVVFPLILVFGTLSFVEQLTTTFAILFLLRWVSATFSD
jgi:hypothetical protein